MADQFTQTTGPTGPPSFSVYRSGPVDGFDRFGGSVRTEGRGWRRSHDSFHLLRASALGSKCCFTHLSLSPPPTSSITSEMGQIWTNSSQFQPEILNIDSFASFSVLSPLKPPHVTPRFVGPPADARRTPCLEEIRVREDSRASKEPTRPRSSAGAELPSGAEQRTRFGLGGGRWLVADPRPPTPRTTDAHLREGLKKV